MASKTQNQGKGKGKAAAKATTPKPKVKSERAQQLERLRGLTEDQLRAELKKHDKAYKDYQVKRAEGVKRDANPHRVGYTAWKQAYAELLSRGKGLKGAKIERTAQAEEASSK